MVLLSGLPSTNLKGGFISQNATCLAGCGFRPLFASVGANVVANGVYGYDAQFKNGADPALLEQVDRAIEEAVTLARASADAEVK